MASSFTSLEAKHVLRGGDWSDPAERLRVSSQRVAFAGEQDRTISFRCLLPIVAK